LIVWIELRHGPIGAFSLAQMIGSDQKSQRAVNGAGAGVDLALEGMFQSSAPVPARCESGCDRGFAEDAIGHDVLHCFVSDPDMGIAGPLCCADLHRVTLCHLDLDLASLDLKRT
jgi:hypothetical protein